MLLWLKISGNAPGRAIRLGKSRTDKARRAMQVKREINLPGSWLRSCYVFTRKNVQVDKTGWHYWEKKIRRASETCVTHYFWIKQGNEVHCELCFLLSLDLMQRDQNYSAYVMVIYKESTETIERGTAGKEFVFLLFLKRVKHRGGWLVEFLNFKKKTRRIEDCQSKLNSKWTIKKL